MLLHLLKLNASSLCMTKDVLSDEQKHLLDGWGRLNPEQKAAVITLLDSFTA